MTFFLLKWVFNAIKRDSTIDDLKLKGQPYVTKNDLVKQLSKNPELMSTIGFKSEKDIISSVKYFHTAKESCLLWEEFLDFFFLHQSQKPADDNNWWRKIGKP